ncbi:MAG: PilZ domain-containing protein [Nitrospirota bacterium]
MNPARRFKRYKVDVMEINGRMVLAKYVRILNISIGGVALHTDKKLNMGIHYKLTIEGRGRTLKVIGMVVWSQLTESRKDLLGNVIPIYTSGMKFLDLSDEKISEIAAFIEEHGKEREKKAEIYKSSGARLYVRFNIIEPEKATLHFYESYRIKELSLSGMLAECDQALEIDNKIQMEIFLSEDKHINLLGRVVSFRTSAGKEAEMHDMGIEFIDMSEEDREKLKAFIHLLQIMDEGF